MFAAFPILTWDRNRRTLRTMRDVDPTGPLTMYEAIFGRPVGAGAQYGPKPAPLHFTPVREGPIRGPLQPPLVWPVQGECPPGFVARLVAGQYQCVPKQLFP